MLYLEDYLEMIENLPMEMRERLTEMREIDLQVQNSLDSLDERVKAFFKKCLQSNQKHENKDDQFQEIKEAYYKTLEDADEKVQLANHIHDLVDRHLRKLDQELAKFKMELEADNAGITEILEKRSLDLDKPQQINNSTKSERKRLAQPNSVVNNHLDKRSTTEVLSNLAQDAARETIRQTSASNSPSVSMFNSNQSSSSISYNLGHIGAGSNAAIAAAASQAIAATQQMQLGRRTSSMKASYDLMSRNQPPVLTKDLTANSSYTTPTPSPSPAEPAPRSARTKKQTSKAAALALQQTATTPNTTTAAPPTPTPVIPEPTPPVPPVEDTTAELQVVDTWQSDPNEPRYCLCNEVSYGDMVGCDNEDCPIEWFHYGCVGLFQAPKGKWFCPQCVAAMKRRGRR
ncbi:inhibitor of growth protein 3 [Patella vulgata]|uniref:inhibitor of growth protein 3 n=1 Tax=Patella vulgata TaxID=6465 RepID=UPI00217F4B1D|nr:inhibitor of growth protein 3 [Patella vulgata]